MKLPFRFFKRHLSATGIAVTIMTFALLGIGVSLGSGWIFTLFALLLALLLLSVVWPFLDLRGLEAVRSAPRKASIGDAARISLTLTNSSRWTTSPLVISDDYLGESEEAPLEHLAGKRSTVIGMKKRVRRRGQFKDGVVSVSSSGPFGLFRFSNRFVIPSRTLVYPRNHILQSYRTILPAPMLESELSLGFKGQGIAPIGVRDFHPGDSLRSVHWRSTARTGELKIKEFEKEGLDRVEIFLDLNTISMAGDEPDTTVEFMIEFAASITGHFLEKNQPVSLTGCCSHPQNTIEAQSMMTAMEWLARVEADGDRPVADLVEERCRKLKSQGEFFILTTTAASGLSRLPGNLRFIVIDKSSWGAPSERIAPPELTLRVICKKGQKVSECWKDLLSRIDA